MYMYMLEDWKPRKRLHHFSTCDVSVHWGGGGGWGGVGMLTFDALAHMFDATQEHRLREMLTFFEYVHTRSPRN